MKPLHLLVLAAAGYVGYQRWQTGRWLWESGSTPAQIKGTGSWEVTYYDPQRTENRMNSVGSEEEARALKDSWLVTCPSCHITIYNPSGGKVYEVNF